MRFLTYSRPLAFCGRTATLPHRLDVHFTLEVGLQGLSVSLKSLNGRPCRNACVS